jgi:hypothetical protein
MRAFACMGGLRLEVSATDCANMLVRTACAHQVSTFARQPGIWQLSQRGIRTFFGHVSINVVGHASHCCVCFVLET